MHTNQVNSITVGGVQKNSTSSSHTHLSVNGIETPVTFAVAAEGAISYSLANVSNAFPASTAVDSPNFLWVESFPLLIESLSIQGRSSWIKE